MAEHWSWLTGCGEAAEYTYSPPTRPSRPPHRPLVKVATSAHLHTIARFELVVAMKLVNIFFVIVTLVAGVVSVYGSAEVMSHVTAHYGQSLEECRKETGLSKEILEEFKHFWSDDFEVVHRELGCTLICMSNKFALLQDDARMHHINMNDYVRSFPEGEVLAEKMVQMIHKCEKEYDDIEDDCDRVVKLAACFKMDAKKAGIAPEVTMIEAVIEQY